MGGGGKPTAFVCGRVERPCGAVLRDWLLYGERGNGAYGKAANLFQRSPRKRVLDCILLYEKIGLTFSCYVAVPIVAPVALCGFYSYNGMGF